MKATDLGKYILKYNDIEIELYDGCFIGFNGFTAVVLTPEVNINQFDDVISFRLLYNSVEFASFTTGQILNYIMDDDVIHIIDAGWKVLFLYPDENIEKIIDAFRGNEIIGELDIKSIFVRYAKMHHITEKQAVYYLISTIDIPEIDQV